MAIKLSKNNLCINQIMGQKSEKIAVESDTIVPDIKPDVLSIISCNGNLCIYKKEILEDSGKVKVEGCVNTYIIYMADDKNASMRTINTNIEFSKTIDMPEIKTGMQIECKAELLNLESKTINGRKVNLKASIQININAYSKQTIEYIDNIIESRNIEKLEEKIFVNTLIGVGETKVYAKDTVSIENIDNLSEIMKVKVSIENKENKISYNKVLTKADTKLKIMYITDDNRINTVTTTIPVMGFIDMQDVSEENICDVSYQIKNIVIKPNNVEEHSIHVEAEIEILCFVYKKQEINILKDLYSRTCQLQYSQKNINIMKQREEINDIFNFRKQEKIEEINQNKIYDVEVKPIIINTQIEDGKITYQGEINLNIIYAQENRISVKNLVEPFEYTLSSQTIMKKTKIETQIEIQKQDFVVMSENNIDIKLDFKFLLNLTKEDNINIIENIEEKESRSNDDFSIIIYYTKIGDTLWNIAKRFGSTVEEIVRVNNIENPNKIMKGMQLFIPR